jgi:predicted DNA-binding transcriptional regulator YafY
VAVISRGPDLLKPHIQPEIQQVVYDALLKEKQIKATYKPKKAHKSSDYIVHPLGIVNKHGVIYLVCTLWNYQDIKQLALHRFESAELIDESSNIPKHFTLPDYVQADHQFSYPITPEMIQLKVLFDAKTGEHLFETYLTDNQTLTAQNDGKLLLEAEISDTQELRWWLSGFGSSVEVVEPIDLRKYFQKEAELLFNRYQVFFASNC